MTARRPARKSADVSAADIRAHLASRREETLVEVLMDQAGRDERLREQLVLEVARHRGAAVHVDPLYRAIDLKPCVMGLVF